MTAELWLDRLLSGKPVPINGKEGETREEIDQTHQFYCSFCGKDKKDVKKLISASPVFICNECVGLCNEILNDSPSVDIEIEKVKARWPNKNKDKEI